MEKIWQNTNVETMAAMLDVTDAMILELSDGEVKHPAPLCEDDPTEASPCDPAIFGEMGEETERMGHIALPIPVVNVQYFYGKRPILPRAIHMSREDLECVLYGASYVVVDPKGTDAAYKQVVLFKDYAAFCENHPGVVCRQGADAIAYLLEREQVPGREHMVLHNLPVLPICMRYQEVSCKEHGKAWIPYQLEDLYERVMRQKCRVETLGELHVPEVILWNEKLALQRTVDDLVSNGAAGVPHLNSTGCPDQSLQELADAICPVCYQEQKAVLPAYTAVDQKTVQELYDTLCPDVDPDNLEIEWMPAEEYDPDTDPVVIAERKLCQLLHPFLEAVIRENFPAYAEDYSQQMLKLAEASVLAGFDHVNPKQPMEPQLLQGIFETVDLGIQKRSVYA